MNDKIINIIEKTLTFVILITILSGCGSVKLTDNWKSNDFNSINNEKILVISKSKDATISKSYEKEMATRLRTRGIDAIERHLKYPLLSDNSTQTKEKIENIVKQFKKDGINGIVVTALKDVKVKTKIINEGGYDSYPTSSSKAFISFRAYNNDVNSLNTLPNPEIPKTTTVLRSTTYFLEAVTYNLSLEGEKQLVGILQVDVTDPESAEEVLKGFSKIVAKQFKKQ
jgi:hypothetical protein